MYNESEREYNLNNPSDSSIVFINLKEDFTSEMFF